MKGQKGKKRGGGRKKGGRGRGGGRREEIERNVVSFPKYVVPK